MRLTVPASAVTLASLDIEACPPADLDRLTQDELSGIERRAGVSLAALGEHMSASAMYAFAHAWLRRCGAGVTWEQVTALEMRDVERVVSGYDSTAEDGAWQGEAPDGDPH